MRNDPGQSGDGQYVTASMQQAHTLSSAPRPAAPGMSASSIWRRIKAMNPVMQTGWSYDTSSGATVSAGELLVISGGRANMYVKSPDNKRYMVTAYGGGGGVGASLPVPVPAAFSFSLADFPSVGTSIYGLNRNTFDIHDFGHGFFTDTLDGSIIMGGSGGMVLFTKSKMGFLKMLAKLLEANLSVVPNPFLLPGLYRSVVAETNGICLTAGITMGSSVGIGVMGQYWAVKTIQEVDSDNNPIRTIK